MKKILLSALTFLIPSIAFAGSNFFACEFYSIENGTISEAKMTGWLAADSAGNKLDIKKINDHEAILMVRNADNGSLEIRYSICGPELCALTEPAEASQEYFGISTYNGPDSVNYTLECSQTK